jgi:hypothetical protein
MVRIGHVSDMEIWIPNQSVRNGIRSVLGSGKRKSKESCSGFRGEPGPRRLANVGLSANSELALDQERFGEQ